MEVRVCEFQLIYIEVKEKKNTYVQLLSPSIYLQPIHSHMKMNEGLTQITFYLQFYNFFYLVQGVIIVVLRQEMLHRSTLDALRIDP